MRAMYGYHGYGGALGWLGPVLMIGFWVLVAVALVFAIRYFLKRSKGISGNSAVDILRERYARSEISKEEFEEKLKALR